MPKPIAATQGDREAAASAYYAWIGSNPVIPRKMTAGDADGHSMVQAFARHRLTATIEGRKEIIAKGCIHKAKAAERTEERADITAWQEAQTEFFDDTILEIVSEYAEWRDAQADDLTAASQLEHSGLITREKYNHICENIRARDAVREAMA